MPSRSQLQVFPRSTQRLDQQAIGWGILLWQCLHGNGVTKALVSLAMLMSSPLRLYKGTVTWTNRPKQLSRDLQDPLWTQCSQTHWKQTSYLIYFCSHSGVYFYSVLPLMCFDSSSVYVQQFLQSNLNLGLLLIPNPLKWWHFDRCEHAPSV